MSNADEAASYGADKPDFGGVYYDEGELVVLFTDRLAEHAEALAQILSDGCSVRPTDRTIAEVQDARTRVQERLLGETKVEGVHSVAIAVSDGRFVVRVGVTPGDDAVAEAAREAARPDDVEIVPQNPPRLL